MHDVELLPSHYAVVLSMRGVCLTLAKEFNKKKAVSLFWLLRDLPFSCLSSPPLPVPPHHITLSLVVGVWWQILVLWLFMFHRKHGGVGSGKESNFF